MCMSNKSKRTISRKPINVYVVRLLINNKILSCFGPFEWELGKLYTSNPTPDIFDGSKTINMFHSFKTKEDAETYASTVFDLLHLNIASAFKIQIYSATIPDHTYLWMGTQSSIDNKQLPIYGSRKLILKRFLKNTHNSGGITEFVLAA